MKYFFDVLNHLGAGFTSFAWPMLWQSGVLVAVLFGLEFAFRRHVRATVRYALWMPVLVKLVLPPSLSFPTSPSYWISAPGVLNGALSTEATRSLQSASTPEAVPSVATVPLLQWQPETRARPVAPAKTVKLPPTQLVRWPAFVALGWLCGVAALLVLAFRRARLAWRLVAEAEDASPEICSLATEGASRLGLRRDVRVKVTEAVATPVVCGLFHPVILLPRSLPAQLAPEQIRAVLLHELAHVRRGDLWVSHLQTALQMVHFYNPLFWSANGRIRRVREEAVDEMVLVALADDAEVYPETLLHLAKQAAQPPLPVFGLIGILESKSRLGQRIRLMLLRPRPTTARLGIKGGIAALFLTVTLLPMSCNTRNAAVPATNLAKETPPVRQGLLSARRTTSEPLYTKFYWVDLNTFYTNLLKVERFASGTNDIVSPIADSGSEPIRGRSESHSNRNSNDSDRNHGTGDDFGSSARGVSTPPRPIAYIARKYFHGVGIDLNYPKGLYFDEQSGVLIVHATMQDLKVVEEQLHKINAAPPQVKIETTILEVSQSDAKAMGLNWLLGNVNFGASRSLNSNRSTVQASEATPSGILTKPHLDILLRALRSLRDERVVQLPSVVTVSGQVAVMEATNLSGLPSVLRGNQPPNGKNSVSTAATNTFATDHSPVSPLIEVTPLVSTDGVSLQLIVQLWLPNTQGSDAPRHLLTESGTNIVSSTASVKALPRIGLRFHPTRVWDGQTLLVGSFVSQRKNLILCLTPTIIDPAGNPVHSDDEMPFRTNSLPPQKIEQNENPRRSREQLPR